MDILIKGMEMPSCCGLCPCFHAEHPMYCQADKTIRMTAPYGKRMEGCPLVALPEHGRCIDADQLQDVLRLVLSLVVSNELTENEISLVHRTIGAISEAINDLDTIVEASK